MHKIKRLFLLLSLSALTLGACGERPNPAGGDLPPSDYIKPAMSSEEPSSSAPKFAVNPLTGEENLTPGREKRRPVAVMINNIQTAQSVQTGLDSADLIFEMVVEGGITRLMAVFQDIEKAPTLGTVRSARYSYADLALSLDAVYVSIGADCKYYVPYQKTLDLQWYDLMKREGGFRVQNGKAYEHTLYTSGEKLASAFKKAGIRMTVKDGRPATVFDFRAPDAAPAETGGDAASVTVYHSASYYSSYKYDAESGFYLKSQNGSKHSDYKTGKQVKRKNVFVLFTKITPFPDNYHMKADLSAGSGYYFSEGKYTEINWKKGKAADRLTFTTKDGQPLAVNPGNSWISVVDSGMKSKFSYQ